MICRLLVSVMHRSVSTTSLMLLVISFGATETAGKIPELIFKNCTLTKFLCVVYCSRHTCGLPAITAKLLYTATSQLS